MSRPPKPELGDYSSNAAMLLAPVMGRPPREIAEQLGEALAKRLGAALERVEVAGPGFLNLFMSDSWYSRAVAGALAAGDDYGAGDPDGGERVNVEFVSANPTGPITVAAGRHAAYGDSALPDPRVRRQRRRSRVLRERPRRPDPALRRLDPRAGRGGRSPPRTATGAIRSRCGRTDRRRRTDLDDDELARRGVELMLAGVRATLERFRVRMDRFASERALLRGGERDGGRSTGSRSRSTSTRSTAPCGCATTTFGDDKDRVLMRSNGEFTYLAG